MNYEEHNKLQAKWERLEEMLCGIIVSDPSCKLSTVRVSGRVRLCYQGRPMAECSTTEKVEATEEIEKFVQIWRRRQETLDREVKEANEVMDATLNKLQVLI